MTRAVEFARGRHVAAHPNLRSALRNHSLLVRAIEHAEEEELLSLAQAGLRSQHHEGLRSKKFMQLFDFKKFLRKTDYVFSI